MSLNKESTNIPYTLGRLFSVLESIQHDANPNLNSTIKDKYFNSASATPAHIFPTLVNLSQKHLKKLENGKQIFYDKLIIELLSILGEEYPSRLSLAQQGAFQLGYYHQRQEKFTSSKQADNKEEI